MDVQADKIKIEVLRSLAIFETTPDNVLEEIAAGMKFLSLPGGIEFIRKGDVGDCMYIIVDGYAKVHDGIHTIVELGPGSMTGEFSILDDEPRSASLTTLEKCTIYQLHREDFYDIIGDRPEILKKVIHFLVKKMRTQNEMITLGFEQREKELSRLVEERTLELKDSNEHLSGAYQEIIAKNQQLEESLETIQKQQDVIIQSERMAALGMIAPIMAHEINTPLGAINTAIENIKELLPHVILKLPPSNDHISEDLLPDFWIMLKLALEDHKQLSSREERNWIRKIERQFFDADIQDSEIFAEKLIKIGIVENIKPFITLSNSVNRKLASEIIDVIYQVGMLRRQTSMMKQSVDRAIRIIKTLNNYVHKGNEEGQPVDVDIVETIDLVTTLYEFYFSQNIDLVQVFEENLPTIKGFHDEISQVWTNLLMNAQYAVKQLHNQAGRIQICGKKIGNYIIVTITDNGPGIPPEIQDRIFKPLFTTKAKGVGTGQGLSICRSIVEKHGGSIHFTSHPGETIFTVELPIERKIV